ncbi:efflux RND transporter periplasmic adaptor subunit, partial [Pyxidicoccus sp. 3LG]
MSRGGSNALRRSLCVWMVAGSALLGVPVARAAPRTEGPAPGPVSSPGSLVGVVVSSYTLDLTAQQEGRLHGLKVRLGERVAAGQVLAQLELEPLQLALDARQANLQAAQAELSRTEVLLLQAQRRLERDARIRQFTAAEAVESAETEVALAKVNVELTRARLAEAQALLAQASRNLETARIRAPFAGRVTELYQVPGVQVGRATPILRLVSEELKLRFAVPEAVAPSVRKGQPVQARLPALGVTLTGEVDSLAPEVDPASRHQKAEARLR